MMDFLFFLKTFVVCLIITLALQVRFDEMTLEQHTRNFITHSALVSPLQGVADGGAQVIRDLSKKIYNSIRKSGKFDGGHESRVERASSFTTRKGPEASAAEASNEANSESESPESMN